MNLMTDCFLAFEIIEIVTAMSYRIDSKAAELKSLLIEALRPVRETAKSSLSTLLGDIRSKMNQMLQLPGDGGPLPLTTDVMARLQLMTAYLSPLSSIMRSIGNGGWNRPNDNASTNSVPTLSSFDVGADGKQLFAHYCTDSIETLLSSLEAKAINEQQQVLLLLL